MADAAAFPGGLAFLQGRVAERAATPQDTRPRMLVLWRGLELVPEGRAHTVAPLFHTGLVCLIGEKPPTIGTLVALAGTAGAPDSIFSPTGTGLQPGVMLNGPPGSAYASEGV
jgi:hypothetical protein